MSSLWEDVRYALRLLARQPGFTAGAILLLALGIGANSAIFSIVGSVLLRPLPFKDPGRLYYVWIRNLPNHRPQLAMSLAEFLDYQGRIGSLSHMAGTINQPITMVRQGAPVRVAATFVSSNYFETLGISPALGRSFVAGEYEPGRNQATILSDGFWKMHFGGDPSIIGKTVRFDNEIHLVAGVMPPLRGSPYAVDAYLPLPYTPQLMANRGVRSILVIARLAAPATPQQAGEELRALSARIAEAHPESSGGSQAYLVPAVRQIQGESRQPLSVLSAAVGIVLLITCSNLANLLLVRAAARQREIAIRSAMGASQWRVFRQMLTEAVLLGLLGGIVSIAIAWWLLRSIINWGATAMPRLNQATLDLHTLLYTFAISLGAGLLFGAAPAWRVLRLSLASVLRDESRGTSGGIHRSFTRAILVVSEVALSVVLLTGAGLLVRTFIELGRIDLGYNPNGVLSMRATIPIARYATGEACGAFFRSVVERLRAIPGVTAAAGATSIPMMAANWVAEFTIDGRQSDAGRRENANYAAVTPQYFDVIGARLSRGRLFTEADTLNAPPVVVVSEAFVQRFFPSVDPLGRIIDLKIREHGFQARIVGVVRDVKQLRPDEPPRTAIYQPHAQRPWPFMVLVARVAGDPAAISVPAHRAFFDVDPEVSVDKIQPMSKYLDNVLAQQRLALVLLLSFSILALVLATVGLYSVMAVAVAQREREIGIRMALGASAANVLRLILSHGLTVALTGLAAGLAVAPLATYAMKQMLFGVKPGDPLTFLAVALLVLLVASAASVVPALRASRVDPGSALRAG
ncbi:MAG: ABC transporter permease [Candidatus Solibacter usitatus]|nr:ABC transporter permease [Candidatus Solibacter usitatus]